MTIGIKKEPTNFFLLVKPGQMDIKAKRDMVNKTHWTQIHRNQKHSAEIDLQALDDAPVKKDETDDEKVRREDLTLKQFSEVAAVLVWDVFSSYIS